MRRLLVVAMIGLLSFPAWDQADDWRNRNRRNNRYEGTGYRAKQSAPAVLTLVSFIGHKELVETAPGVELTLQFFLSGPKPGSIVARELNPVSNYRMEPFAPAEGWRRGWNQFAGWSTSDVLSPAGISSENLGALIELEETDPQRDHAAPVIIRPAHSTSPLTIKDYVAHFVPSTSLQGGSYGILSGCGAGAFALQPDIEGKVGNRPGNFAFPVVFRVGPEHRGILTLKIDVTPREATAKPVTREYCFAHEPSLKAP